MTGKQILVVLVFLSGSLMCILGAWRAGIPLFGAGAIVIGWGLAYLLWRLAKLLERRHGELSASLASYFKPLTDSTLALNKSVDSLGSKIASLPSLLQIEQSLSGEFGVLDRRLRSLLVEQAALLRSQRIRLDTGVTEATKASERLREGLEILRAQGEMLSRSISIGGEVLEGIQRVQEKAPVEQRLRRNIQHAIQDASRETARSMEALLQLSKLFPSRLSPLLDGWAMDPVAVHGIIRLLARTPRPFVLELGSGTSTLWLARAVSAMGGGKIVSLEHQSFYADQTSESIALEGLDEHAQVVLAPLVELCIEGDSYKWYGLHGVELPSRIDMLVVDGPPGEAGRLARFPALPLLQDRLGPGSVVIVDDAHREDEVQILEAWADLDYISFDEPARIGPRTVALTVGARTPHASKTHSENEHEQ